MHKALIHGTTYMAKNSHIQSFFLEKIFLNCNKLYPTYSISLFLMPLSLKLPFSLIIFPPLSQSLPLHLYHYIFLFSFSLLFPILLTQYLILFPPLFHSLYISIFIALCSPPSHSLLLPLFFLLTLSLIGTTRLSLPLEKSRWLQWPNSQVNRRI